MLLWEARREGPDFGHYLDWGNAAVSGDIFQLSADVLSPGGVPFSLSAAAPGMLFATIYHAVGETMEFRTAAYLTGWAAAMLLWVSAFIALRSAARDDLALTAFGIGALFVGTHLGFYSFSYSTEGFASAFVAAAWAIALRRPQPSVLASATVGVFAGLLLLVRPYLVLYALPPLWLVIVGSPRDERQMDPRSLGRALAASVPVILAVIESAVVNRWMTGAPFHSPSVYGDFRYRSVDLLHPQFGAVLAHPWRGLLVYHPLYGIAFVALLVGTWRDRQWRTLWAPTLVVVLLHLWVQSAWHIWWLGGSFGMRGLAPAALPLMVALVATLARGADEPRATAVWWARASLLACAWSFLLLRHADDDNLYFTWSELAAARASAAGNLIAMLGVVWVAVTIGRVRWNWPKPRTEITWSALALLGASTGYLLTRSHGRMSLTLLVIAIAIAAGMFYLERLPAWRRGLARNAAYFVAVILFAAQAVVFARLAGRTERYVASGSPPPRQFGSVGTVSLDDLRQSYREYASIPGFEERKRRLLGYVERLEVDAERKPPVGEGK